MSLEVKDLMVRKVVTVKKDASLKEVITVMNDHEIGCVVVCKNQRPIGIITERYLLKRVLANIPEMPHIKAQQIMSTPVFKENQEMPIEQAVGLMIERKIKKLPITHNGKLVGLITLTDILRFQPQLIRIYKILRSDIVPPRLKKVFDYYTLLYPKLESPLNEKVSSRLTRKQGSKT